MSFEVLHSNCVIPCVLNDHTNHISLLFTPVPLFTEEWRLAISFTVPVSTSIYQCDIPRYSTIFCIIGTDALLDNFFSVICNFCACVRATDLIWNLHKMRMQNDASNCIREQRTLREQCSPHAFYRTRLSIAMHKGMCTFELYLSSQYNYCLMFSYR
jgi:hypothetical protein